MLRFLTRPSPLVAVVESLLLLFAITWLDLATGHQVSLVLFYTAPIVFAVWLCDNRSPFIVAALKMDLQEGGLEKLAATAGEIEKHLTESVKQARILAHGLVPVQFDEAGLPAALQELAASTSRLLAMDCTFAFAGEYRATHNDKATHLYRIAQE